MTVSVTTPTQQPVPNWKAAGSVIAPIIVSFVIGAFGLVWKMDKNAGEAEIRFSFLVKQTESVAIQVTQYQRDTLIKLDELDKRLRVLELEQVFANRQRLQLHPRSYR